MLWIITGIIISYFLGTFASAYLMGRALKGIDIRKAGSGNIGATNALRVLGKGPGIIVLLLDVLKGFIAVFFVGGFILKKTALLTPDVLLIALGLTCIAGHIWNIFLGFKGGKGMATTLGVILALSFSIFGLAKILIFSIIIWIAVFLTFRIVSIASIASAIIFPLLVFALGQPNLIKLTSIILALFIIYRHKSNIIRIAQGKEKKIF